MIKGFEHITFNLTKAEKETLLPRIYAGLKSRIGKENAISSTMMVKKLKSEGFKGVTDVRIRKVIHEIRFYHIIKRLVSSSKGYYVTNDLKELKDYIISRRQREFNQRNGTDALNEDYKELSTGSQQSIFNEYGN